MKWPALAFSLVAPTSVAVAQAPATPATTPRAAANIDLTGQWVAVVTEDWRWRMVTPPKGDYSSIPLNAEGRRVADGWDQAADVAAGLQFKPYGAPGLLRLPGRIRIGWKSDDTLLLETDAGSQVRELAFGTPTTPAGTWQGVSRASWEDTRIPASSLGIARIPVSPPSYALKVVTTGLRPGYLRKNGVPYSAGAVLTEYFDTLTHQGTEWLVVTTKVEDPT